MTLKSKMKIVNLYHYSLITFLYSLLHWLIIIFRKILLDISGWDCEFECRLLFFFQKQISCKLLNLQRHFIIKKRWEFHFILVLTVSYSNQYINTRKRYSPSCKNQKNCILFGTEGFRERSYTIRHKTF